MDELFLRVCRHTSRVVTSTYSTSFSIGVRCLDRSVRDAIYAIYGFARLADEIVDTFTEYDNARLLDRFEEEYYYALSQGISLNPVINTFQHTVRRYRIPDELVQAFLRSMRCDLHKERFDEQELCRYIYGSADVVGLMCLMVFVNGDAARYAELEPCARRLGSAFQKINFLRDIGHDTQQLHRFYFPRVASEGLTDTVKEAIVDDVYDDYRVALEGIRRLPHSARLGVYIAYLYYVDLTNRILHTPASRLAEQRIRVPGFRKLMLLAKGYWHARVLHKLSC